MYLIRKVWYNRYNNNKRHRVSREKDDKIIIDSRRDDTRSITRFGFEITQQTIGNPTEIRRQTTNQ